jgi:hypothetical protein
VCPFDTIFIKPMKLYILGASHVKQFHFLSNN